MKESNRVNSPNLNSEDEHESDYDGRNIEEEEGLLQRNTRSRCCGRQREWEISARCLTLLNVCFTLFLIVVWGMIYQPRSGYVKGPPPPYCKPEHPLSMKNGNLLTVFLSLFFKLLCEKTGQSDMLTKRSNLKRYSSQRHLMKSKRRGTKRWDVSHCPLAFGMYQARKNLGYT